MSVTGNLAIDVHGLCKSFNGKTVVDNVSLQVERGEIYGFLGPNGSGKTTSIRMMCGLLTPDAGSGSCLGFDILRQSGEIKRHVGYMTQKFSFWDDLTIRENLEFVARVFGMADRVRAVEKAISHLGLQGRANQLTGTLSGGWKQRVALAACMLHQPQLLLLDEPTAGVDPMARRDFWNELHDLAEQGISVLVSTHYMDEAERCHKLAYIAYGKLLASGTAARIISDQHLYTLNVEGGNLGELARQLEKQPEIEQTVMFGASLHVSGKNEGDLIAVTKRVAGPSRKVEMAQTGLEDVFIYMMRHTRDNFS